MVWRRVTYRFVKTSGPERIGAEWWQSLPYARLDRAAIKPRGEEAATSSSAADPRDYYIAEDDGGRRFWLFREGLYGRGG